MGVAGGAGAADDHKAKMARCLRGVMVVLSQLEESTERERSAELRAARLARENAALRRRLERACAALEPETALGEALVRGVQRRTSAASNSPHPLWERFGRSRRQFAAPVHEPYLLLVSDEPRPAGRTLCAWISSLEHAPFLLLLQALEPEAPRALNPALAGPPASSPSPSPSPLAPSALSYSLSPSPGVAAAAPPHSEPAAAARPHPAAPLPHAAPARPTTEPFLSPALQRAISRTLSSASSAPPPTPPAAPAAPSPAAAAAGPPGSPAGSPVNPSRLCFDPSAGPHGAFFLDEERPQIARALSSLAPLPAQESSGSPPRRPAPPPPRQQPADLPGAADARLLLSAEDSLESPGRGDDAGAGEAAAAAEVAAEPSFGERAAGMGLRLGPGIGREEGGGPPPPESPPGGGRRAVGVQARGDRGASPPNVTGDAEGLHMSHRLDASVQAGGGSPGGGPAEGTSGRSRGPDTGREGAVIDDVMPEVPSWEAGARPPRHPGHPPLWVLESRLDEDAAAARPRPQRGGAPASPSSRGEAAAGAVSKAAGRLPPDMADSSAAGWLRELEREERRLRDAAARLERSAAGPRRSHGAQPAAAPAAASTWAASASAAANDNSADGDADFLRPDGNNGGGARALDSWYGPELASLVEVVEAIPLLPSAAAARRRGAQQQGQGQPPPAAARGGGALLGAGWGGHRQGVRQRHVRGSYR